LRSDGTKSTVLVDIHRTALTPALPASRD